MINLDSIIFNEGLLPKSYLYNSETRGAITRYINQIIKKFDSVSDNKKTICRSLDDVDPHSKTAIQKSLANKDINKGKVCKLVTFKGKLVLVTLKKAKNGEELKSAELLVTNNFLKQTALVSIPYKRYLL